MSTVALLNLCLGFLNIYLGYINYQNENYKLSIFSYSIGFLIIILEILIIYDCI